MLNLWRRPGPLPERPVASAVAASPPLPSAVARLSALLDLVPHPVLLLNGDGTARHANDAAREQLGELLPALLRHPALQQAVVRLPAAERVQLDLSFDVPVRRVVRASLRAEAAPIPEGLVLLALTDRTEQDAVERMRADFIANASHELRTPLASLIGFIETLQGPAADDAPARVRFLAIMANQAARMRRLIDELLSLSRIQMHEHRRPEGRVPVAPLLRRIADEHEPLLRDQRSTLSLAIADDLPPLLADADQIAQVLGNLLDNAVKYGARPVGDDGNGSGEGARILLAARPSRPDRDPSRPGIVLSVEDQGPGIAAHHLPRLTERFYRADDQAASKPGSGLGMAIVKHIVGRHGGRLSIDSAPGLGTRVHVWLPSAPPP
ncbi:MAG: histidine kinase [Gluconacetobacter diazotrophicus]|nr:histidine kinase [Gluconacetobacter diazotrophicus]